MTLTNQLLDPLALPPFADITPDAILPAVDIAIATHEAVVEALTTARPVTFAEVWLPYERANNTLDALWAVVSHLHGVVDTPELRTAYVATRERLVGNWMKVGQNRDLYDVFVALSLSSTFSSLPDADRVAVERAIRDFTLTGVALEADDRERFKANSVELSMVSNAFDSAVRDATDAWSELIVDEALLAGISDADKAMFRDAAAAKEKQGWLVTLQQPSINAIMTFADDRDLRARVYHAFNTRASDQGPQAGQFDNSGRIARILSLRHESAALLGFADPVAWSLATKMAPSADKILTFLRDLARRAKTAAEADVAEMRAFAAEHLGIDDFQPWDSAFTADRLRRARYAVDEQEIRAFFPVNRVMAGWQDMLTRLFGIRLVERHDVSIWHPSGRYFDVADMDGTVFSGLYLDLHSRHGKRGGAWMDRARSRLEDGDAVRLPVAYLICNFAPTGGDAPSLLSHYDVTTLLHETGHCLHLLFTQVNRPSIAGTSGFEWDAIELPSQLMEDFAWDREVLTGMSGHYQTGEAMPADLFDRMLAARRFQSGMLIVRQVELALFDLLLHLGTMGSDPIELIEAIRDEVAVIRPPAWHRFPHSFSHIFSGGYAAGYYGYLWAELLAADGFQAFVEAGVTDRATGNRFRHEVLARGATRPAADSFRAFRGRDAEPTAMLRRHGLIDQDA